MDERRTLSLNVFLNTLEEGCKNERRYCFILGAGASKTSGIPTGEELAKQWHGEILEQCSKEEIKELKKRLGVRSTKPSSRAYFDLYAMRFFPDYQNGSAFLERTLERAQPSLGYYPLAALLANTRNNLCLLYTSGCPAGGSPPSPGASPTTPSPPRPRRWYSAPRSPTSPPLSLIHISPGPRPGG